jgi:DNA processing protein
VITTAIPPDDPAYPPALAALAGAGRRPPTLYLRGRLPTLPGVAVVGTRRPTEEACAFTRTLATALVAEGLAVWSGGAMGIDAAAHEAALEAGGITVLVAGGGLDRPYPPQHRELFERIPEQGGALVARVPDGTPPMAPWFLQRNEILAALTSATVVVQAGFASGARSTAAAARRLGRPLCVVPQAPWDERGQGCALELSWGATAVCSATDVLAALGRPPPPRPSFRARGRRARARGETLPLPGADLPVDGRGRRPGAEGPGEEALSRSIDGDEGVIFAVLGADPLHFDEVCERSGLPARAATGALLTLTLGAVVVEGPAGFFRRRAPSRS